MSDRLTLPMWEPVQAHRALQSTVWPQLKAMLIAGHRMVVEVRPETRSLAQNAKLHATLTDIASQVEWAGKKRDVDTWKRLLTAAWCRTRGEAVEFLPALDGHGVDIVFRRTSELTKSEMADLVEFINAWAADQGVQLRAPEGVVHG